MIQEGCKYLKQSGASLLASILFSYQNVVRICQNLHLFSLDNVVSLVMQSHVAALAENAGMRRLSKLLRSFKWM